MEMDCIKILIVVFKMFNLKKSTFFAEKVMQNKV